MIVSYYFTSKQHPLYQARVVLMVGTTLQSSNPDAYEIGIAERLARVESANVTCLAPEPPIFWDRAAGFQVWDVDGNRYVDLGGGFGVANVGHAHPRVAAAVAAQAERLMHAMAVIAVLTTVGIVMSLIFETLNFFDNIEWRVDKYLFGTNWSPLSGVQAGKLDL